NYILYQIISFLPYAKKVPITVNNLVKYTIFVIKTKIGFTFKSYVKLLVKVLCLSVLFYSGIEVTKEYFSYPYVYRLSVESNKGSDLPPISVCTERYVYFDKKKIATHFNLTNKYKAYK